MDEQARGQLKKIITDSWDKNVDIDMTCSYGETEGTDEAAGIALDGILAKLGELGMLKTHSAIVLTDHQRRYLADLVKDDMQGTEVVIERASKNGSTMLPEYWQELEDAVTLRETLLAGLDAS